LDGASSLPSTPVPGPGPDDHVRGPAGGTGAAIIYLDLACPRCAGAWAEIASLPLELCVRHFPIAGKRPRSPVLHVAAEAVACQSEAAFWAFWDSLLADRAHVDDPHLWERVTSLDLDLHRFQADRRNAAVAARVGRDFHSGIRAGVTATPAGFVEGAPVGGELGAVLRELARS